MRNMVLIGVAIIGLTACSFSGTYLEPPASRASSPDINSDMRACLSEAKVQRELTSEERKLIEGKETARFFMHGRPVVSPEGKPALHQSALPQSSNDVADRYAVCFLKRGYSWEKK